MPPMTEQPHRIDDERRAASGAPPAASRRELGVRPALIPSIRSLVQQREHARGEHRHEYVSWLGIQNRVEHGIDPAAARVG